MVGIGALKIPKGSITNGCNQKGVVKAVLCLDNRAIRSRTTTPGCILNCFSMRLIQLGSINLLCTDYICKFILQFISQ